MFAFVIWDCKEERLFAVRDRMGIKPLYYSFAEGNLLCASEIKALFASRWCTPQLNLQAVPAPSRWVIFPEARRCFVASTSCFLAIGLCGKTGS